MNTGEEVVHLLSNIVAALDWVLNAERLGNTRVPFILLGKLKLKIVINGNTFIVEVWVAVNQEEVGESLTEV